MLPKVKTIQKTLFSEKCLSLLNHFHPFPPLRNQLHCFLVYLSCVSLVTISQYLYVLVALLSCTKDSMVYILSCLPVFQLIFLGKHSIPVHGNLPHLVFSIFIELHSTPLFLCAIFNSTNLCWEIQVVSNIS